MSAEPMNILRAEIARQEARGDRYFEALLEIQQIVLNGMLDGKVDPAVSASVEAAITAATNPQDVSR